eukprot:scaffold43175_cov50-Attheya_sp.AAC.2
MANKYYFAAAFLLGTASTAAFVLPRSGQSSSLSRLQKETPTPSFLLPFQQFSVEDVAARDVSMKSAALSTVDMLVTSSIFGVAVFATIAANKKNVGEEVEEGGDFSIPATKEAEAVEEAVEEVVVVEPVVEKKKLFKKPKVVKEVKVPVVEEVKVPVVVEEVKVPVVEEVTDEQIVEAVVEAVAVAEVAIKSPTKIGVKSPAKDISTMRKSVTSTREGEEEKKRRLAAAAKAKQVPTKGKAAVEPVVEEEEPPAVVEEEAPAEPVKECGRKRKFLGKLVKKTIKPWKKWSDL